MHLRDLETALGTLPPDQREALVLVCIEDVSYARAAEILGIPIGTVMSRLHRARENLRRTMAGETRPRLRSVQ